MNNDAYSIGIDEFLLDIADAIREKDGTTEEIEAIDFAERIRNSSSSVSFVGYGTNRNTSSYGGYEQKTGTIDLGEVKKILGFVMASYRRGEENSRNEEYMYVEASNDGQNWTRVLTFPNIQLIGTGGYLEESSMMQEMLPSPISYRYLRYCCHRRWQGTGAHTAHLYGVAVA